MRSQSCETQRAQLAQMARKQGAGLLGVVIGVSKAGFYIGDILENGKENGNYDLGFRI